MITQERLTSLTSSQRLSNTPSFAGRRELQNHDYLCMLNIRIAYFTFIEETFVLHCATAYCEV
jgi:hypothetical protein